ncbi:MAG: hydroxyethylthiazole kinase [Deltaproteobacteria bacterium]
MLERCGEIWDQVKASRPLIHCITNYVTVNAVANSILAIGASPAMCEHPREAGDFVRLAGGLYLNLGTLTVEQEQAMTAAAIGAREVGIPLLIDPVACGVIPRKIEVLKSLMMRGKATVIKGNSAEIKSLAGLQASARGVDSMDSGEGLAEACMGLSEKFDAVIAGTGEVDVIAAPGHLARIYNGTVMFREITGAGCMAGGVMTACLAVAPKEAWLASITGLLAFSLAGQKAAERSGINPGSFRIMLDDELHRLSGHDILEEGKVEWL